MIIRRVPAGRDMIAEICFTDRFDGDFAVQGAVDTLEARRRRVMPGSWTWLTQVHGRRVFSVAGPGAGAGERADAAVTRCPRAVLSVHTADCAPVCLVGDAEIAVAHVGWRGLVTGVVPAVLEAMRTEPDRLSALIGPCIRPAHYEFGRVELAAVELVAGTAARSVTASGTSALDLGAAISEILTRSGVRRVDDPGHDTAGERWFSHRLRGDSGRQATALRLAVP